MAEISVRVPEEHDFTIYIMLGDEPHVAKRSTILTDGGEVPPEIKEEIDKYNANGVRAYATRIEAIKRDSKLVKVFPVTINSPAYCEAVAYDPNNVAGHGKVMDYPTVDVLNLCRVRPNIIMNPYSLTVEWHDVGRKHVMEIVSGMSLDCPAYIKSVSEDYGDSYIRTSVRGISIGRQNDKGKYTVSVTLAEV